MWSTFSTVGKEMDKKRWIVLYCLVALISACTASLPPIADQTRPPQTVTPAIVTDDEAQSGSSGSSDSAETKKDDELFLQSLRQIAGPLNQDASATARQNLEALLSSYPQSRWSDAARTILRLMGELDTYRQRLPVEQDMVHKLATDRNRTLRENEQLKKELRLLSEKYQVELAELQQENEQLKKDLQLLKNLEIQLDKREKMLR
jgi:DNA repair ATPase RecN